MSSRNCLYVIFDRVAQESGPVFEAKNDGVARRQYEQASANQPYAHEMMLLRIGEVDHELNKVTPVFPAVEVSVTNPETWIEEDPDE